MKIVKYFLFILLINIGLITKAQVAINTDGSPPNKAAILDIKSNNKGVLIPHLTQSKIAQIINPAAGTLVYSIEDEHFYFFDPLANEWKELDFGTSTISPITPCASTFIDSRDGKSYNAAQIGTQCWMTENLNIGTALARNKKQIDNDTIEKHCYNIESANCTIYGGLYQWDEMMQYATGEGIQGICPDGWHLPSNDEWSILTSFLGGNSIAGGKMKEAGIVHWYSPNTGASNSSGFTARPGGYGSHDGTAYSNLNGAAYWWTSSESLFNSNEVYRWSLSRSTDNAEHGRGPNYYLFSVRCIKD